MKTREGFPRLLLLVAAALGIAALNACTWSTSSSTGPATSVCAADHYPVCSAVTASRVRAAGQQTAYCRCAELTTVR